MAMGELRGHHRFADRGLQRGPQLDRGEKPNGFHAELTRSE
jgi:hypothetical protein